MLLRRSWAASVWPRARTPSDDLVRARGRLPCALARVRVGVLGWVLDGIALWRGLGLAGAPTAVIMLTARGDVRDRLAGFDAGADDYLAKPFHFEEVLARVRALSRRQQAPLDVLRRPTSTRPGHMAPSRSLATDGW